MHQKYISTTIRSWAGRPRSYRVRCGPRGSKRSMIRTIQRSMLCSKTNFLSSCLRWLVIRILRLGKESNDVFLSLPHPTKATGHGVCVNILFTLLCIGTSWSNCHSLLPRRPVSGQTSARLSRTRTDGSTIVMPMIARVSWLCAMG